MATVDVGGLRAVQLHGQETPALVEALSAESLIVIKALFVNARPGLDQAPHYPAAAFLVECAGGRLPGGNAMQWDWSEARRLLSEKPVVLAGGLTPDNIEQAIRDGDPDAVDISSGVESTPGRKDLGKVIAFCRAVAHCHKIDAPQGFRIDRTSRHLSRKSRSPRSLPHRKSATPLDGWDVSTRFAAPS